MPEKFIDANALTETLAIVAKKFAKSDAQQALMGRVFYILEHRPEGVVRCKDCTRSEIFYPEKRAGEDAREVCYCKLYRDDRKSDDFCSYGERKEYE